MTKDSSSHAFGTGCRFCKLARCSWSSKRDFSILFFRLCLGGMMLTHGYPKMLLLLSGHGNTWLNPLGIGAELSLTLCVFAEFFASIALILGALTRPMAMVLAINFWVIVFIFDAGASWGERELAALYFVCYLTMIGLGAGRFSVDHCLITRVLKKEHRCACS